MTKMSELSNDVTLSYYDSLLRKDDVDLLRGPCWLNDAVIGFYFEYMNKKIEKLSSQEVLLIGPELTQLLKLSDKSDYTIFLDPLNAMEKNFIFFSLNDCENKNAAGGSHWSLLLFSQPEKTCFHIDSMGEFNKNIARAFSIDIMSYLLGEHGGKFINVNCPQQNNVYDCGLFVLCFVDVLLEYIYKTSKIEGCNYNDVKLLVSKKREHLLELIQTLTDTHEESNA